MTLNQYNASLIQQYKSEELLLSRKLGKVGSKKNKGKERDGTNGSTDKVTL